VLVENLTEQRRGHLVKATLMAAMFLTLVILGTSFLFSDWHAKRYIIFYLAPLVLAVGLWARWRLLEHSCWTQYTLLLDGAVLLIAATRLTTGFLPVSGHMLFLTYSLLTIRNRSYKILATVLAVETTVFKLMLWTDWLTWALGVVLGLVAAFLYRRWDVRLSDV